MQFAIHLKIGLQMALQLQLRVANKYLNMDSVFVCVSAQ